MNKVIIIHLNGIAYQLEEDGYEALRVYLDVAHRRLEGNPDRDEIITDIEQAIADKFRAVLNPNKTVVLTAEVRDVLAEMGPVQGDGSASAAAEPAAGPAPAGAGPAPAGAAAFEPTGTPYTPRRLFRLREGAMIGGVCSGLAAYLGADVTLIRIIFAIVGITFGAGILLYIAMMVIIPYADSTSDVAAAHGDPSTTDEIIRRAREGYYAGMRSIRDPFTRRKWKRQFKREMRQHRRDLRDNLRRSMRQWGRNWHHEFPSPPEAGAGWWVAYPFIAVLNVLIGLVCVGALLSLILTGSVFGVFLPAAFPFWLQIVLIVLFCRLISWPTSFMRHGFYSHRWAYPNPLAHLVHTITWFALIVFGLWFLDRHTIHGHEILMRCKYELQEFAAQVRDWWSHL